MRCLFLNIYYEDFLKSHYSRNDIRHLEYMEQWDSIQGAMFGDSDFYSRAIEKQGWEAHDLITNCNTLQQQWARENDYIGDKHLIWVEQIRRYQPDVVYSQGLWLINDETYPLIKDHCKLIVGQVGSVLDNFESDYYDIIFTSHPEYPDKFREAGVESHYLPLAFEPRVWERVKGQERDIPISFIGQLTAGHTRRKVILDALSGKFEVRQFIGNKWGMDMFNILARSYITINCSHDYVYPYGGNMRLFEATGCGALCLTENFQNLPDFFTNFEVLAYNDADHAVELVKHHLENREDGEIAAALGQVRTLKDHTYKNRMAEIVEILEARL